MAIIPASALDGEKPTGAEVGFFVPANGGAMPAVVGKKTKKGYPIKNADTGKTEGYSKTKQNAQKSANARNAAKHGWKPTRGK